MLKTSVCQVSSLNLLSLAGFYVRYVNLFPTPATTHVERLVAYATSATRRAQKINPLFPTLVSNCGHECGSVGGEDVYATSDTETDLGTI